MSTTREVRWRGKVASRGLALGVAAVHRQAAPMERRSGAPDEEHAALDHAVARARESLAALLVDQDDTAAAILEFQVELLADAELSDPAFAAIGQGEPADAAWSRTLDEHIAGYASADDDYFRARADDLRDLRDRVLAELTGAPQEAAAASGAGAPIYVGGDLTPSRFLEIDWTRYGGAALTGGSASSHVAILARARGVPLLIDLETELDGVPDDAAVILDAEDGWLILDPTPETRRRFEAAVARNARQAAQDARYLDRPAVTAAGDRVAVLVNIDDPAIVDGLDVSHCDGIGLTRTEFLFRGDELADEEAQYRAYARLVAWAEGRPVTIRTLDAGGDKPVPGLTPVDESNSFLGVRGLRLSLLHRDVFSVQLRALARAAALGPVKVMCPMVTAPAEMSAVRELLGQAVADLEAAGSPCAMPQLGMMVEVPAAALTAASFPVDFYSIGSNDLIQYVTATARDNPALASLHDPKDPAVLDLIARTVAAGGATGREVSLCGDMASEPDLLDLLLGIGLRSVSVAPASLGRVKAAIGAWHG